MQNFSYENEFDLHENESADERIFIRMVSHVARFDTEAKGNSEMAYC